MQRQSNNQPASSWAARLGLVAAGLLIVGAVLVYSTLYFGLIRGEEFSPHSFKRRHFYYYEIPVVGIQVSPITHADRTGELEQFLVNKKLVGVEKDSEPRWDLVRASHVDHVAAEGDARILTNYLDAKNADDHSVWLAWSRDHDELAEALWPQIAELARQELYVFIPDVLHLARRSSTLPQFQESLDELLTRKYVYLANTQQSLGRHQLAIELYTSALTRTPDHIEALQGRAQSFDSLGDQQQAAADRARAGRLHSGR